MKTIDEIKKEFKAATGKDLPIYTYEGELGVLYESYNGYCWSTEFIPMDEFLTKESINFDNVRWVTVGADGCEEGEEITDNPIRNDENDQKLMVDDVWSPVTTNKSDEYVRELLVITNQYYNWTSERTRMCSQIDDLLTKYDEKLRWYDGRPDEDLDDEDKKECSTVVGELQNDIKELKKEWEEIVAKYEDPEGWADFEDCTVEFQNLLDGECSVEAWNGGHAVTTKEAAHEAIK